MFNHNEFAGLIELNDFRFDIHYETFNKRAKKFSSFELSKCVGFMHCDDLTPIT